MYRQIAASKILVYFISLLLLFLFIACLPPSRPEITAYPLYPVEQLAMEQGVVWVRGPFRTYDARYPLVSRSTTSEPETKIYQEVMFPTDVYVVFKEEMETPLVFLARSPHGGCILRWRPEDQQLADPCYGSIFTLQGEYILGPSPRHLDRLPSEVRDGMIWVRNEIIYGEPHMKTYQTYP